jgi:hypothetical protein
MPIYCDESGGIGRGVMTLAAIDIEAEAADTLLQQFRDVTGYIGELKGSKIDLPKRGLFFELLKETDAQVTVGIALSVLKPKGDVDRGDHDIRIYAQLLEHVIDLMLPELPVCDSVIIDDGRYAPNLLSKIRGDIAQLVGPCGSAKLELSHRLAGLQLADVIANSFFNRALVNDRQGQMAAVVQPFLDSGQIVMQILSDDTKGEDHQAKY